MFLYLRRMTLTANFLLRSINLEINRLIDINKWIDTRLHLIGKTYTFLLNGFTRYFPIYLQTCGTIWKMPTGLHCYKSIDFDKCMWEKDNSRVANITGEKIWPTGRPNATTPSKVALTYVVIFVLNLLSLNNSVSGLQSSIVRKCVIIFYLMLLSKLTEPLRIMCIGLVSFLCRERIGSMGTVKTGPNFDSQ